MSASSGDFHQVGPAVKTQIPEILVHKKVIESALNKKTAQDFSNLRKHEVAMVNLPSHTLSMTIGGLSPEQSSGKHRHNYETMIYILEGKGFSQIEDRRVEWEEGDAIYVPVWTWHQHTNLSNQQTARYLACENAPLLQNLGGIALREEAERIPKL